MININVDSRATKILSIHNFFKNEYSKAIMRIFYLMVYSYRKARKLVLLLKIGSSYFSIKYKNLNEMNT
jgi:hypothetical protein